MRIEAKPKNLGLISHKVGSKIGVTSHRIYDSRPLRFKKITEFLFILFAPVLNLSAKSVYIVVRFLTILEGNYKVI